MRCRIISHAKTLVAALMIGAAVIPAAVPQQAHAFVFGGIVFDPKNYAQNLLTAARTLQTINNQIRQLQNEADMLINDAKNLAKTGFNPQAEINRLLGDIAILLQTANSISYQVADTDRIFRANYPEDYSAWSKTQMAAAAEFQWVNSRNAFHDALLVQSQIVQTVKADTATLDRLLIETDGAGGALSVAQTGNQIMALEAKQSMQIQELMAAQYRADALERARDLQIERESKIKLAQFVGGSTAYAQP